MKPKIKPGDIHIIVNDFESRMESEMKCYNSEGKLFWTLPCLAKGQTPDYTKPRSDTPPGLYKIGAITETQSWEPNAIKFSFGRWFLDLEGLEQNEERYGRAGCGIHGGGSSLPDPLAPRQKLVPTHGCIRVINQDLDKVIVPLVKKIKSAGNTVYVTVHQH